MVRKADLRAQRGSRSGSARRYYARSFSPLRSASCEIRHENLQPSSRKRGGRSRSRSGDDRGHKRHRGGERRTRSRTHSRERDRRSNFSGMAARSQPLSPARSRLPSSPARSRRGFASSGPSPGQRRAYMHKRVVRVGVDGDVLSHPLAFGRIELTNADTMKGSPHKVLCDAGSSIVLGNSSLGRIIRPLTPSMVQGIAGVATSMGEFEVEWLFRVILADGTKSEVMSIRGHSNPRDPATGRELNTDYAVLFPWCAIAQRRFDMNALADDYISGIEVPFLKIRPSADGHVASKRARHTDSPRAPVGDGRHHWQRPDSSNAVASDPAASN